MRRAARAWEEFWFAPEATSPLALVRIAFGVVVLAWTIQMAPDANAFFADGGIAPQAGFHAPAGSWGPLELLSSPAAVALTLTILALASICLISGRRPRLAALLIFLGLLALERRNPFVFNSGDNLLRVIALVLALAPAGGAALASEQRSRWALRLLQVQLSVIYLAAASAKLTGSTWRDGTALAYALRLDDLERFALPAWLTASDPLTTALTYCTLGFEVLAGLLVWSRRLRPWVLGAGVAVHLTIDLVLRVGFFSYAVLVLYLAFVPPEVASRWIAAVAGAARGMGQQMRRSEVCSKPVAPLARRRSIRAAAEEGPPCTE